MQPEAASAKTATQIQSNLIQHSLLNKCANTVFICSYQNLNDDRCISYQRGQKNLIYL